MRVLVTGGTGFVGGHSVAALVAAGHEVRVLARSPERVPQTLGPFDVDPHAVVEPARGFPCAVVPEASSLRASCTSHLGVAELLLSVLRPPDYLVGPVEVLPGSERRFDSRGSA